jgi:hypothetical protein
MKVGDLVHGRFEVIEVPLRTNRAVALDRMTGRRALTCSGHGFLSQASSSAMVRHLRTLASPDLAEVLAVEPTVLALGEDEGTPTRTELGHLALDLLERCMALLTDGVTTDPDHAWIARSGEAWSLRIPAGLSALDDSWTPMAELDARAIIVARCERWLARHLGAEGPIVSYEPASHAHAARALARRVSDAGVSARAAAVPDRPELGWQRLDFDRAEQLGRAEVAARERSLRGLRGAARKKEIRYLPYLVLPFAAVLHHQACRAFAKADSPRALALLDEAITHDRTPRYLTTKALVLEALGRENDAQGAHEDAVGALPRRFFPAAHETLSLRSASEAAHASRTAHAYGAFLARRSELEQAAVWLRHATRAARALTDRFAASRHAALAVVLLRLRRHDEARAAARAALALDAAEPSALAVMARLG